MGLPPECLVFLVDSVDGLSKLWKGWCMERHFASIDFAPGADGYPFDSRLGPKGDGGHEGKVGVLRSGESFWCWGVIKI